MKLKFFDKWEFDDALDGIDCDPIGTKMRLENYLLNHQKDYSAYPYYASVLITLGELGKAEEVLKSLQEMASDYIKYENYNKIKYLKNNILYSQIKLMSYQGKYDELYQLLRREYPNVKELGLDSPIFYCRKKVGDLIEGRRSPNSYLYRQIVEYHESDFLEHIKKHLAEYNQGEEKLSDTIFATDFPLLEVIEEIKKYIPSDKKINGGFYDNVYTFKYDYCGKVKNKISNYFKVICFDGTSYFITMYPYIDGKNLPYIDLNYLQYANNKNGNNKKKVLSQTDKFNRRYKR